MWQKPLLKKKLRKERKLENPVIPKEDEATPSIYVHDADSGVQLPPNPQQLFAVLRVKGLQYKVSKDDRVMVEKIDDFEVGQ